MHVEAHDGTVVLKKVSDTFGIRDVMHISELLKTLAPFSQLVLDFTAVRELDDAALLPLVGTLQPLAGVAIVLRGLTRHAARLLKYLGLRTIEVRARA
jgi:hypothetical protein